MTKRIAFVDDEKQILRALKRSFILSDYDCIFFDRGSLLLEYLEENPIDILITDIRMPEMDGITLLKTVKQKQPKVIRMVLSGYTDSRQILAVLDSGLARQYVYKPWDNEELLAQIDRLLKLVDRMKQPHLMEAINGLGALPTIPEIYQKVTALIESEASAQEVAKVVESDPSISSHLLRIVNTAYYGLHTGSVQKAIVMMGMSNVRQIILTNAVFKKADKIPNGKVLWQHAAVVNQGVAFLYQQIHGKHLPSYNETAGLMHTLGMIFMATLRTKKYSKLMERLDMDITLGNHHTLLSLESEIFGADHTEISSFLLNWWEFPFDIVEVAYHYRNPQEEMIVNRELVAMVHFISHMVFDLLEMGQFQFSLDEGFCQRNGNLLAYKNTLSTYLQPILIEKGE
ncbi:MAG: HDOD domain-containing protein [Bacillota bacterium]|nr:HDOD domain-containing protein [Bacillota bacterium]